MTGPTRLHLVTWGYDGSAKQSVLQAFMAGFGSSVYYTSIINSGYYSSTGASMASLSYSYTCVSGAHVSHECNRAALMVTAGYHSNPPTCRYCYRTAGLSPGSGIGNGDVESLIADCIDQGNLPLSANAIYIALLPFDSHGYTGSIFNREWQCSIWCAYHANFGHSGLNLQYAVSRCPIHVRVRLNACSRRAQGFLCVPSDVQRRGIVRPLRITCDTVPATPLARVARRSSVTPLSV